MIKKQIKESIKIKNKKKMASYEALKKLVEFTRTYKFKPMGANEDDKIIYGID